MDRRDFSRSLGALTGALVLGFSGSARAWVGERHDCRDLSRLPRLDGRVIFDDATLAAFSVDLGLLEVQAPRAVLIPGSVEDVARMVKFCARNEIEVAARGQGHATGGQALVRAGLIIDMRPLSAVLELGEGYVVAEAGLTWRSLLDDTIAAGQTPPVLTGYTGLSIGGTLSVGGVNGMCYRLGAQIEHVLELWVVTGEGELVRCSERRNSELFSAVLGGLGQYGLIVQAKLRLVPAQERAIEWATPYLDPALFFSDIRRLVAREEIDVLRAAVAFDPGTSAPIYVLNTIQFYSGGSPPDFGQLHRDLHIPPGATSATDRSYLEFLTVVDVGVDFLRSIGQFEGQMHPWLDLFLPDSEAEKFISETVSALTPDDVGPFGQVLLFPVAKATRRRSSLRLPNDEISFLFDILTQAPFAGFEANYASRMLARNRALFERARELGGTRYPIGSLEFSRADWRRHYGPEWGRARAAKAKFDPHRILTPGQGIF